MLANTDIQILTHCDYRRVFRALLLAQSVPSEIDVICAVNGTNQDIRFRLKDRIVPDNLHFLPSERQYIYPANALRNMALEAASKEWVCYIDCDFVFCSDFWDILRKRAAELNNSADRVCYCPVALWDPSGDYLAQRDNPKRFEIESDSDHRPPRSWEECNRARLFKNHEMYFSKPFGPGCDPYEMTGAMKRIRNLVPAEPWGLLKRKHSVYADEDFRSGPMDKQQVVCAMLDCGIRFFAIPDIFIFHQWHPESPDNKYDRVRNECLWARRYRSASRTYLLVGLGGALPRGLVTRLQGIGESSNEKELGNSASMPGAEVRREVGDSRDAYNSFASSDFIFGPDVISREVFARNLRLCVFFNSPAYYRETRDCSHPARGDTDTSDYVRLFCESGNIHDAIASIENVSALFHLADPSSCSRTFRNLTGMSAPPEWFETDQNLAGRAKLREDKERSHYPNEYVLYDFARAYAGSIE
jgi:glycosyltransferase involved in cell wall biosynthesis